MKKSLLLVLVVILVLGLANWAMTTPSFQGTGIVSPLDEKSRALITVDHEHRKIHDGKAYAYSNRDSVAQNARIYTLLNTTSTAHLRYGVTSTGNPFHIDLYEYTTVSNLGTALTAYNVNRRSSNTTALTITNAPTITAFGNALSQELLTSGKNAGGTIDSPVLEWLLKPNTLYLLMIASNATGTETIDRNIFWYEE